MTDEMKREIEQYLTRRYFLVGKGTVAAFIGVAVVAALTTVWSSYVVSGKVAEPLARQAAQAVVEDTAAKVATIRLWGQSSMESGLVFCFGLTTKTKNKV